MIEEMAKYNVIVVKNTRVKVKIAIVQSAFLSEKNMLMNLLNKATAKSPKARWC